MSAPLISKEELNQLTDFSYALGQWVMTHDSRYSADGIIKQYEELKPALKEAVPPEEIVHLLHEVQPYSNFLPEFERCLKSPASRTSPAKGVGSNELSCAMMLFEQGWNRHCEELGVVDRENLSLEKESISHRLMCHVNLTHGIALDQDNPVATLFEKNRTIVRDLVSPGNAADKGVDVATAVNTLALQMTLTPDISNGERRALEGRLEKNGVPFTRLPAGAVDPLDTALDTLDRKLIAAGTGDHVRRALNRTLRDAMMKSGLPVSKGVPEFQVPEKTR